MPAPQFRPKSVPKSEFWKEKNNKRNARRGGGKRSWKKIALLFILIIFLIGSLGAFIALAWLSRGLPSPDQLIEREIAQTTTIYDRSGEYILYEIHGEEKRTLMNLDEVPDYVKQASIAIEDKNFYRHRGFSMWAIARTIITNVLYSRRAGGSTLTQQFVKNAVLGPEKKYSRKVKELVLAQRIEKKFTKDEILQMYLNEIPYGSNAYGVEAASQKYFGKSVKDINIAEAALLAALPQAPSRYSPYGPNRDLLLGRKDYILDLMEEQGYISQSEKDAAKSYQIVFQGPETNIKAPHFVMYVKSLLADRYGEKNIEQGGYKIYTTLDWRLQSIAEQVVKEKIEEYGERYNAGNAALVAIDPKTGQILTMVGSRDYFNSDIDGQVNVAVRPRQPGSSLKPLIYSSLFELGYTPNTILYDVETNFSTNPSEPYIPRNYNGQERGPVNIRQSLAGSLNIPAVKAIYLADINRVLDLADNMGYTTLKDRSRFGLALVLGGGEVQLLEHVNAYSAFAREGLMHSHSAILRVEDKNGKILEEYEEQEKRVLTNKSARMINSILSDNNARTFVFGARSWLNIEDRQVAVKTGTTNNFHDAWTIGYTPSIVAGVWVGNSNNKEMTSGADGSVVAAPIWNEFMKQALIDSPKEIFKETEEVITGKAVLDGQSAGKQIIEIDSISGLLATEYTPVELIQEIEVFSHHSILHYINRQDPLGPEPQNPEQDSQYLIWEKAIARWAEENEETSELSAPTESDNLHIPENFPELKIIKPKNNELINDNQLLIEIEASANRGINQTEYFINNILLEKNNSLQSTITKNINFLNNGSHKLTVRVCDDVLNCLSKDVDFRFNNSSPINNTLVSGRITHPSPGLSVNLTDFPLNIGIEITGAELAANLSLFFSKNDDDLKIEISNTPINQQSNLEFSWMNQPEVGNYLLGGEITTWSGKIIKIDPVNIVIQ